MPHSQQLDQNKFIIVCLQGGDEEQPGLYYSFAKLILMLNKQTKNIMGAVVGLFISVNGDL